MDTFWYLSKIKLLENLSQDDLLELEKFAHTKIYEEHTLIQTPFHPVEGLSFVKKGKIRLYSLNPDGKSYTIGIMSNGNVFGQTKKFSLATSDVYIETLENSLICNFTSNDFDAFILERPLFLIHLTKQLSTRIEEQNRMLSQFAMYDIRERILFWLAKLARDFGKESGNFTTIDLNLSHQDLAHMIGATRESVSSILSDLSKEGLIQTSRLNISILTKACNIN